MGAIRDYQARHGLSDEEMARDLSAYLGRKIGPTGYRLGASRTDARAPKAWVEALGLTLSDDTAAVSPDWALPEEGGTSPPSDLPGEREASATPRAPAGARVDRPSLQGDYGLVKKRLVQAYEAIGAGTSMITGNRGHAAVFDTYAPNLADAWVEAAKANEQVAKIVRFMESGGPVGELVIGHIILVGGLIYVGGRGPDLYVLYGGKFEGYRAAAFAGRLADEAGAATNGAAGASAVRTVGDDQG